MADTYTTKAGDVVDLIARDRRGATADVTEEIYRLNPGLADLGPVLPAGVVVLLPEPPAKTRILPVPRIWTK